ncbi:MAG: hypothetical protein B7Z66_08330 [Chromatiales bacterium 21-64-14]|nr:MAG: hypothetical protein B7Z66_08330 [Chromatiales bacterium 21-64-14]
MPAPRFHRENANHDTAGALHQQPARQETQRREAVDRRSNPGIGRCRCRCGHPRHPWMAGG